MMMMMIIHILYLSKHECNDVRWLPDTGMQQIRQCSRWEVLQRLWAVDGVVQSLDSPPVICHCRQFAYIHIQRLQLPININAVAWFAGSVLIIIFFLLRSIIGQPGNSSSICRVQLRQTSWSMKTIALMLIFHHCLLAEMTWLCGSFIHFLIPPAACIILFLTKGILK